MDWKKELEQMLTIPPCFDEPMSKHTSIRIGGRAECLVLPESDAELREVLLFVRKQGLPLFILGSGTNLLVRDGGMKGIVLKLGANYAKHQFADYSLSAGAAASLHVMVKKSIEKGCQGLEFAEGIPGSFGGAIYMNAGAFNSSVGEIIQEVHSMDFEGNLQLRSRAGLDFSYRMSNFQGENVIILGGLLQLAPGDREEIVKIARRNRQKRRLKQPALPSAGSVFRNPPGEAAGKLIDEAGAKGLAVGDAIVSTEHGNFIVNAGRAEAEDVLELVELVRKKVWMKFKIALELEIMVVGEKSR